MELPDLRASFLARVEHPLLRRIVEFWFDRCKGERWPLRADLDPLELKFALGYLSLIDVHENPRRYFYRLDGSFQAELFGADCTGKFLDTVASAKDNDFVQRIFSEVVDSGEPQYNRRAMLFHNRPVKYEVAILPLSKTRNPEHPVVDVLLTAVIPHWKR